MYNLIQIGISFSIEKLSDSNDVKLKKIIKINYISNMTSFNNNENILDVFFPLLPLTRTYTAYCPYCGSMTSTFDPCNRIVFCLFCIKSKTIQKNIKGFLVRKKVRKLKEKELIFRWLMKNNVSGIELSRKISLFL